MQEPKHCRYPGFGQFGVEIKPEGEYFMTSIKGRYFRRIMDERGVLVHYAGSSVLL